MAICALSLVFLSKIFTSGKWQRADLEEEGGSACSCDLWYKFGVGWAWAEAELSTL